MSLDSLKETLAKIGNAAPTLQEALETGLFDEYSEAHPFNSATDCLPDLLKAISWRLSVIGRYFSTCFGGDGQKILNSLISDKLSAGKAGYDPAILLTVLSEIEVISYLPRFFFLENPMYEPRLVADSKRKPEIRFEFEKAGFHVEVKCPNLLTFPVPKVNDIIVNFRGRNPRDWYRKRYPRVTVHFPLDNKIREYLESAESKFGPECVSEEMACYGLLIINWPDFRFDRIDSVFYNPHSGIFTDKSFIRNEDGTAKTFEKICGVIVYQGRNYEFVDFRYAPKMFIRNPRSKTPPVDKILRLFAEIDIQKPRSNYVEYEQVV
jgi:hypothetical protein